MGCPLFVDYTRECVEDIRTLPPDTYNYCQSKDYQKCPFYIKKQNLKTACEFVDKCPFFNNFNMNSFDEFMNITKNYCLSEKHEDCERYKLKMSGKNVPIELRPDGEIIELRL